jgi:hypothetical protein
MLLVFKKWFHSSKTEHEGSPSLRLEKSKMWPVIAHREGTRMLAIFNGF